MPKILLPAKIDEDFSMAEPDKRIHLTMIKGVNSPSYENEDQACFPFLQLPGELP